MAVTAVAALFAWFGASLVVLADGPRGMAVGVGLASAGMAAMALLAAGVLPALAIVAGGGLVAFQQVRALKRSTWPEDDIPQQLHLDTTVPTREELEIQHARALDLGATLRYDRSHDPQEPLRVYADPAGHPFCIFVAAS